MRAVLGLALGAILVLSTAGSTVAQGRAINVPKELNGLPLTHESAKSAIAQVDYKHAAIDKLDMYSIRLSGNVLAATLEVARFKSGNDTSSPGFQQNVASQMGSTLAQALEVSGTFVYLTTARGIDIAIWFRGPYVLILVVRTDYAHPKDLLRSAVDALT